MNRELDLISLRERLAMTSSSNNQSSWRILSQSPFHVVLLPSGPTMMAVGVSNPETMAPIAVHGRHIRPRNYGHGNAGDFGKLGHALFEKFSQVLPGLVG
jgi:hypothetical protein